NGDPIAGKVRSCGRSAGLSAAALPALPSLLCMQGGCEREPHRCGCQRQPTSDHSQLRFFFLVECLALLRAPSVPIRRPLQRFEQNTIFTRRAGRLSSNDDVIADVEGSLLNSLSGQLCSAAPL